MLYIFPKGTLFLVLIGISATAFGGARMAAAQSGRSLHCPTSTHCDPFGAQTPEGGCLCISDTTGSGGGGDGRPGPSVENCPVGTHCDPLGARTPEGSCKCISDSTGGSGGSTTIKDPLAGGPSDPPKPPGGPGGCGICPDGKPGVQQGGPSGPCFCPSDKKTVEVSCATISSELVAGGIGAPNQLALTGLSRKTMGKITGLYVAGKSLTFTIDGVANLYKFAGEMSNLDLKTKIELFTLSSNDKSLPPIAFCAIIAG